MHVLNVTAALYHTTAETVLLGFCHATNLF